MIKSIYTLIPDIQEQIKKKDGWFTDELTLDYAKNVGNRLQEHFNYDRATKRGLRLSGMGPKCPRALWYSVHHPELDEPLPANAEMKFSFGHMIEALAIVLAKAAGHEVTGEQDAVELDGIVGHRDCVINGRIVDVKSASSRSFAKFKYSNYEALDSFGYLDQLDGYVCASADDPLVTVKDKGYLLVIQKELGSMYLYEHCVRPARIRTTIDNYKRIVERSVPPPCECKTEPQGKSGNIKLDFKASYSAQKYSCFPNLRTFIYASGPEYLTKVVYTPDVDEVDMYGRKVYA